MYIKKGIRNFKVKVDVQKGVLRFKGKFDNMCLFHPIHVSLRDFIWF